MNLAQEEIEEFANMQVEESNPYDLANIMFKGFSICVSSYIEVHAVYKNSNMKNVMQTTL